MGYGVSVDQQRRFHDVQLSSAYTRHRRSGLLASAQLDDVTVELCIYRLEHTKWTLDVVDAGGTSTVWDDEFETDDAAYAEFQKTIAEGMFEFQPAASKHFN